MAKAKRKVRKFDSGGAIEEATRSFRERNPDLQEEPGLEQADKDIMLNLMPAGRIARTIRGIEATAPTVTKEALRPAIDRALKGAEVRSRARAMSSAGKRASRKGVDPRDSAEAFGKEYKNVFRERAGRSAEKQGKVDAAGYDPRNRVYKKGGGVKKYARGGGVESKGKTRGRFV